MSVGYRRQVRLEARRMRMSQLALQGKHQYEIAEILGKEFGKRLTQQAISLEMQVVKKEWKARRLDSYEEKVARELAKVDERERECFEAFERSVGEIETVTERTGKDGTEVTRSIENQAGDPRFQQLAMDCVKSRCQILGLNAPTNTNVNITGDDLMAAIAQGAKRVRENGNTASKP